MHVGLYSQSKSMIAITVTDRGSMLHLGAVSRLEAITVYFSRRLSTRWSTTTAAATMNCDISESSRPDSRDIGLPL